MQQQPVYLTKYLVERGACVIAPYSISQGTLPAIVVTSDGTNDVTDIAVGSLTINEQTTVAQFANAVVVKGKHSSRLSRTVPLLPIYLWRYAKHLIFTTLRIFLIFFRDFLAHVPNLSYLCRNNTMVKTSENKNN